MRKQKTHTIVGNGWEDADTEALKLARRKRVLAGGREDNYADTKDYCSIQGRREIQRKSVECLCASII